VSASEESAGTVELPGGRDSERVTEARSRARQRLSRQRDALRPLGVAVVAAVTASAIGGHPAPGLHGEGLGLIVALGVFALAVLFAIDRRFTDRDEPAQAAVIASMGAAGVALVALQSRGATVLAGGAAVWMAVARLPLALGIPLAAGTTIGLDVTAALSGTSTAAIVAATLVCALLGLVAYFLKQGRAGQERTELLLAQLEDAREQQLQAAAVAERGRIAGELHDVLAHSLSGASIQLQGARVLAEREQTSAQLSAAIERAGELVRDGLANARAAVGALRGEELPGVGQLEALVASFRDDMHVDVTLRIEGSPHALPADAGLALYRGVQEALTNVARYAPGSATTVVLRYGRDRATLTVEDRLRARTPKLPTHQLGEVGGGRGLAAMRERIERAGGRMRAGPTEAGWRVELKIPA
jgi:signal transduction histidine kinase